MCDEDYYHRHDCDRYLEDLFAARDEIERLEGKVARLSAALVAAGVHPLLVEEF